MTDETPDHLSPALAETSLAHRPSALDLAVAAWLDTKAGLSQSQKTLTAYREGIARFREALHSLELDLDSDPRAVALAAQGWAARRDPESRGRGAVSPSTYNQRLAILSSFYTFARRRGLLEGENPIARVERRRVDAYAGAQPLDDQEVQRRLRAIDRSELPGARDYALLAVLLQTGRRRSEAAALRWGDVQLAGELVTLQFRRTKGGKAMRDTLSRGASRALLAYLRLLYGEAIETLPPESPLWVNLARNGERRALSSRSVALICEDRLGVSAVHALRHTFARVMEDAGAKVSEIQARLGHASLATTGRYLAALKRAENAHAEQLAQRFGFDD